MKFPLAPKNQVLAASLKPAHVQVANLGFALTKVDNSSLFRAAYDALKNNPLTSTSYQVGIAGTRINSSSVREDVIDHG